MSIYIGWDNRINSWMDFTLETPSCLSQVDLQVAICKFDHFRQWYYSKIRVIPDQFQIRIAQVRNDGNEMRSFQMEQF